MSRHLQSPGFRDAPLADQFALNGFCKLPLLDNGSVTSLARLFKAMNPTQGAGFVSSIMQPPRARRAAHQAILPHLAPALASHVEAFRIVLCSFVARYPSSGQEDLPLHQDWSFVDERIARSISVWIPLQAVNDQNGCLTLVPGSHRHDQPPRGIGCGFRYRGIEKDLRKDYLVSLPADAGEAIFFDHRLIHGSRSNESTSARLAIGAVLVPAGCPLFMGAPQAGGGYAFHPYPDSFLLDADVEVILAGAAN